MTSGDPRLAEGLRLLRARRWFDAHEAFEAIWMKATGDERVVLQGLIHVAVAFEHLERGNPRGAHSQWRKAQQKLDRLGPRPWGIEIEVWRHAVAAFFDGIDLERRAQRPKGGPAEALPDRDTWPVPCE